MTSTTTTPVEPEGGSDIELAAEVRTAKAGDALREKLTAGVVITGLALLAAVVAVNTVIFVNTRAYNEAAVQRTLAEEFDLTVTDDQASKIVLGEEAVVVTTYGTKVELRSSDATASGLAKNPHPTFTIAVPLEKS